MIGVASDAEPGSAAAPLHWLNKHAFNHQSSNFHLDLENMWIPEHSGQTRVGLPPIRAASSQYPWYNGSSSGALESTKLSRLYRNIFPKPSFSSFLHLPVSLHGAAPETAIPVKLVARPPLAKQRSSEDSSGALTLLGRGGLLISALRAPVWTERCEEHGWIFGRTEPRRAGIGQSRRDAPAGGTPCNRKAASALIQDTRTSGGWFSKQRNVTFSNSRQCFIWNKPSFLFKMTPHTLVVLLL